MLNFIQNKKELFNLLDFFMLEYGWGFNETVSFLFFTPLDVVLTLYKVARKRKQDELHLNTKLSACAAAAGFSGKIQELDKLFKSKENKIPDSEIKSQVQALWNKMGKSSEAFKRQKQQGKVKF